ncbi:dihydropteroate synthase [Alsobacter metallidurans]|uniref:Dihydropteroate synthase n=1 Tax=Alsobacter metallidurans TaxID=340221 RepID=A0A917ICN0_9HYPH|nr:dihydropteroate synthase [Alsobacter metallidurans]GGH33155.1 dihydropteroate synthase [Alsobacter metallidurans]
MQPPGFPARTLIMGIVNVTPDSFSDGGDFFDPEVAVRHAQDLEAEGADIVDLGGESTRPGHQPIGQEEEQRRVLPVVAALSPALSSPISIDTYRADTARKALAAGARIINDVWGLQRDPDMAAVAADHDCDVVAMHNRETLDPSRDIVDEFRRYFDRTIALARHAGLRDERLILDPGIGFGKSWAQNMDALRRVAELRAFGFRVLVGASRKSFLCRILGDDVAPKSRIFGTLAAHSVAIAGGADIIRVHDVRAHVDAVRTLDALWRDRGGGGHPPHAT